MDNLKSKQWKRYLNYKDSGVEWLGEIPESWEVKRLKFITRLFYGDSLSNELREEGDIFVYGSNGIVGTHNIANTLYPCIVVGRKGSYGKVTYSEKSVFAIDTTYFIDTKAAQIEFNFRWLFYSLLLLKLDTNSQDIGVPGLSREFAYNHWLPFPTLSEQQKIAQFLDLETQKIDTLINKKQRLIELLKEKRTAIISHAVTKGLNPDVPMKDSGVEWLGMIPESWKKIKIKYILHKIIDTEHKTAPFHPNGKYFVVRTSNVRNGQLLMDDAKYTDFEGFIEWTKRGKPEIGDILFTREAPAGEACLVPRNLSLCLGQRMVLFKVNHEQLYPNYVIRSIYGGISKEFITLLCQGSTVTHFNMSDIGSIPLLLPYLSEQQKIADYLDSETQKIDTLINKIKTSIEYLKEYRTALISAAVTGKIDVREEV